jgi:hypothetical protein
LTNPTISRCLGAYDALVDAGYIRVQRRTAVIVESSSAIRRTNRLIKSPIAACRRGPQRRRRRHPRQRRSPRVDDADDDAAIDDETYVAQIEGASIEWIINGRVLVQLEHGEATWIPFATRYIT